MTEIEKLMRLHAKLIARCRMLVAALVNADVTWIEHALKETP